jgi:hypothetical protein
MERSKRSTIVMVLALSAGCMSGQWLSTPAERPLSRNELASRQVTVDQGENPRLSRSVAEALTTAGFNVVSHPPYHKELELSVAFLRGPDGPVAVATLRSDGFFVDEVRVGGGGDVRVGGRDEVRRAGRDMDAAAVIARTLAGSQAMADFVRNNGLPQQSDCTAQ